MRLRHLAAAGLVAAASLAPAAAFGESSVAPVAAGDRQATPQIISPEPRIVGGSIVPDGKYPFAAALIRGVSYQFCGGSLIAPTWVVTAAHCVTDGNGVPNIEPSALDVVIGDYDLTLIDPAARHDVVDIVIHPDWAADVFPGVCGPLQPPPIPLCFDSDIALLELATPSAATPVVLARDADSGLWDDGDLGTVMGWGESITGGPASDQLRAVDIPFNSTAECIGYWGDSPFFYPGEDVCAGANGADSCFGDSGGPLIADDVAFLKQVGIVSFGSAVCGVAAPAPVYTKVAAYLGWITSETGNKAPFAGAGSATTVNDMPTAITLRGADSDGDALTFTIDTPPGQGSLGSIIPASATSAIVVYTPNPGYAGPESFVFTDSFTYVAGDGALSSNVATATIAIELVPDTVGLVDVSQGKWYLRNRLGLVTSFFYGNPGDLPLSGDWDGDGTATPGLYRQSDGFFYARNSNTQGTADNSCFAGDPSDIPVVGDWDGDGDDNLGIYRPSEQKFYLFTITCTGPPMGAAQISLAFGNPGDMPVAGDWNGDGMDEIGLRRESTGFFYWRNTRDTGIASGEIFFGDPDDRFVAGDWGIIDGVDSPAIFRPGDLGFYFRHTLTEGNADSQFTLGGAAASWLPVSGSFGLG